MLDIDRIISEVLKQNFKDVHIYNERAESMKLPAFLIKTVQSSFDKKVGNMYKNELFYQIVYIEDEDTSYITDYEKYKNIAFKLFDIFEFVDVKKGKLKGYDMNYRIQDNTLMFFVTFKVRYYRDNKQDLMQKLKLRENKKGE
ncbi:hypothetical protein HMPREF1143_1976 [Peptoanaerobacter stomatis]|uniref:Phage protein n=1 Tax=Peptoanaerobacter stomatis TaxID=796937 RepID=J4W5D6_9FIRM|nr:hypothetical protein [Peptoanaerobacter stomatis]EJU21186.1 hypothetical protein HMPREF1143_1976 [Peptoanaerobacter stomatis]